MTDYEIVRTVVDLFGDYRMTFYSLETVSEGVESEIGWLMVSSLTSMTLTGRVRLGVLLVCECSFGSVVVDSSLVWFSWWIVLVFDWFTNNKLR